MTTAYGWLGGGGPARQYGQYRRWEDGPPWRRPHRRRPVFFLAIVIAAIQIGAGARASTEMDGIGYALLAAGPVALVWRRISPLGTLAVTLVATYGYLVLSYPRGPYFLAAFLAIVAAARASRRAAVWALTAICFLPVAATLLLGDRTLLVGDTPIGDVPQWTVVATAAWTVFALVIGEAVRAQRERFAEYYRAQAEADRARSEQSRRQASDERLRIAGELHDVLGHHLSLINVRAGVALHLLDTQPEQAREALSAIKVASAEALREVRGVLATLGPRDGAAPRTPAPGLAAVDDLAAEAEAAGTPVHIVRSGPERAVPGEVERAAYRIVRESLTNVRRHAGPGAVVTVTLVQAADGLTVRVQDTGVGPVESTGDAPPAVSGNGIAGMRERATALGGRLRTGPGPDGAGFRVEAFLPVTEESEL